MEMLETLSSEMRDPLQSTISYVYESRKSLSRWSSFQGNYLRFYRCQVFCLLRSSKAIAA
jgi:hypothetical protein